MCSAKPLLNLFKPQQMLSMIHTKGVTLTRGYLPNVQIVSHHGCTLIICCSTCTYSLFMVPVFACFHAIQPVMFTLSCPKLGTADSICSSFAHALAFTAAFVPLVF